MPAKPKRTAERRNALESLYAKPGHHTPLQAAKLLAALFKRSIPATHLEAIQRDPRHHINAYSFCKMIQEQCKFSGCTFRQASIAGQKAAPTLWAPPDSAREAVAS
jgi:hypothetical protein